MVEQVFELAGGDKKVIERVLFDENVHYLHMILPNGEGLPVHYSNSNVYMTVIKGNLSIGLNEQKVKEYQEGTMLKIPVNTKMNVRNLGEEILELIVVKAPAPQS